MSSRIVFVIPAAALVLLAGCDTATAPSVAELDASVAVMTRGDVTRGATSPDNVRTVVRLDRGFAQALQSAVMENQQFTASVRRYREANAGIRVQRSIARPQVAVSATVGGTSSANDTSLTTGAAGNLTLSQLVYDGGVTRANVAGATAQAYAARSNVLVAGNAVGRDAAMAWIDLWQANTHLALLRERLNEVSPMVERIERLISNGIVDRAALAAAQRQLLDLRLEEERLTAAQRNARERFNRYFGARPNSVTAPQGLFTDTELAQMAGGWQDSPALISAAAELIVAERAVEAARARMRPTVRLGASASSPMSRTDNPDVNIGLTLQHTFGDGGRRRAEIELLEERLQAGRSTFEDALSGAAVDAATALSRRRSLHGTISVVQAQIETLDTERSTLRSQITSGQANLRQLVESEVLYYRARARLIEVRGELVTLEVMLASQTGRLMQRLNIDIDAFL